MKTFRIAVIPGDGIGKEVMPEGLRAVPELRRGWLDELDRARPALVA